MNRVFRPSSCAFRSLLVLAIVAWTAFAVEAIAHPLVMGGQMKGMAGPATSQTMSPHCKGMPSTAAPAPTAPTPAPFHPAASGHGCCAFGHCDCAAFCGNIVGVPSFAMAWPLLHERMLVPLHAGASPIAATPQFRPPIA